MDQSQEKCLFIDLFLIMNRLIIYRIILLSSILFFSNIIESFSSNFNIENDMKQESGSKPVVSCTVGECEPAFINSMSPTCVGHIKLNATALDNCSADEHLIWEYKIDAFNDGVGVYTGYDFRVGAISKKGFVSGDTLEYSHNPFADDRYNPFDASGTYPIGVHKIYWFVENECGDVGVCCTLFEIKDCKAPSPKCISSSNFSMPTTGCIDVWAKDLNDGSVDNCTSQEDLKFYFDGDPNKTSVRICCDDFVAQQAYDSLQLNLEVWV